MRFTTAPEPLIKMVSMVGERTPERARTKAPLHLIACADRVCVESQGTVAETNAAVYEDGQCALPRGKLLEALQACRHETNIIIQGDNQGLHIGAASVPVISYRSRAIPPEAFQIFLATDAGVVSSQFAVPAGQVVCLGG